MKLNLGCGKNIKDDWINIDRKPGPGIDIDMDLDSFPWPFKDNSAKAIFARHVLEHMIYPVEFVLECYRILSPGGTLELIVPHRRYRLSHILGHRSYYDEESIRLVIRGSPDWKSHDQAPLFDIVSQETHYEYPLPGRLLWSLSHLWPNLVRLAPRLPFGQPCEIRWVLKKVPP